MWETQILLFSPKCHPGFKQPQLFAAPDRESELEAELLQRKEPAWGPLQEKELMGRWMVNPKGEGRKSVCLGWASFSRQQDTDSN